MRIALLAFYSFLFMASTALAQCVAVVQDVVQDENGAIRVITQYSMNGKPVMVGGTRYNEESGTEAQILQRIKDDVSAHCKALIGRIEVNQQKLNTEMLNQQKSLTRPIIDSITPQIVGYQVEEINFQHTYKGKEITVNADGTSSVKNVSVVVGPVIQ